MEVTSHPYLTERVRERGLKRISLIIGIDTG